MNTSELCKELNTIPNMQAKSGIGIVGGGQWAIKVNCSDLKRIDKKFMIIPYHASSLLDIRIFDHIYFEKMEPRMRDLIESLLNRFILTPIEKRKSIGKYRLRTAARYVTHVQLKDDSFTVTKNAGYYSGPQLVIDLSWGDKDEAAEFTEDELAKMKKYPVLEFAIDQMKERI